MALSAALLVGGADQVPLWAAMSRWALLWVMYPSLVNVGQVRYAFGGESLLLEAGLPAVFLGNLRRRRRAAPPVPLHQPS